LPSRSLFYESSRASARLLGISEVGIVKEMNMAFWSDKTIKARGQELIDHYRVERVQQGAYELSVGE
jgi:hypothetical protein